MRRVKVRAMSGENAPASRDAFCVQSRFDSVEMTRPLQGYARKEGSKGGVSSLSAKAIPAMLVKVNAPARRPNS